MEESTDICVPPIPNRNLDDLNILAELNTEDVSPARRSRYLHNEDSSSDNDSAPVQRARKRLQQFSDSDTEKENLHVNGNEERDDLQSKSESETELRHLSYKTGTTKSRIRMDESSSDSDVPNERQVETLKNEEQQIRMKNKRNKMQQKFRGLLSSRTKSIPQNQKDKLSSEDDLAEKSDSEPLSDNENMSSIAKIKQKIKKSITAIPSICDPDTSDEEEKVNHKLPPKQRLKKIQKSTQMIEAKPVRMSAKQAMENMHLIKSESNRMLREKAVSLPYHRPKALSLKDIMARRKPAVTSDGKALPIKMNEDQLKQYALQLEQRQKEMMELCKSESDEDSAEPELVEKPEEVIIPIESGKDELVTNMNIEESNNIEETGISAATEKIDVFNTECNEDDKGNASVDSETNQNDSNTDIKLVYNDDSIEEENELSEKSSFTKEDEIINKVSENSESQEHKLQECIPRVCLDQESQLICLQYSENNTHELVKETDVTNDLLKNPEQLVIVPEIEKPNERSEQMDIVEDSKQDDFFSDDDVNMEDIDKIIKNAEIMKDDDDNVNAPMLIKDTLNIKPKLMGAPGMVIDLDGTDPMPKRSGVELLKERFTYFSKLKTPEELEREREKKLKPGAQHLKLKQELEEQIAEKRSLDWAKRLEEEKQLREETDKILDDADDADDSIEKVKARLDNQDEKEDSNSETEEEEEELVEDDVEMKDKPRKHNGMLDDEAEESDMDENEEENEAKSVEPGEDHDEGDKNVEGGEENNSESSEDEESSESEEEEESNSKPKKCRILRAFEDSDDEDTAKEQDNETTTKQNEFEIMEKNSNDDITLDMPISNSYEGQLSSQDDVIQLAQRHESASDDLFISQEKTALKDNNKDGISDEVLSTQTFSISSAKPSDFLCPSQPYHDPEINVITDGFSQNVLNSQPTQSLQSQPIGEDILALCTGKFYDNQFVSQTNIDQLVDNLSQDDYLEDNFDDNDKNDEIEVDADSSLPNVSSPVENNSNKLDNIAKKSEESKKENGLLLKSILDELDDPEFDKPKPNKFFTGASQTKNVLESTQMKKRLIIDSDDDTNERNITTEKKKLKKKRPQKRALQISDDEEEEEEGLGLEDDDYMSDIDEGGERVVEYDSEENEIEVKPDKPKKKRKTTDFFEQEAELTSEDEWVGSGDEDEHGLDRMEREEGDDDVFHQGNLRKELGQIHMRDVLDQDKREVRLLQELLFEDGDLGGGHRQRKFRWRNAGDEEAGTMPDEFADTQEEEFESEEQWRKQRHEREVFLRQLQKQDEEEGSSNVTVNRTTIIKANLSSKSMSTLLIEANQSNTENTSPIVPEKKTVKDIPSPKKSFSILQQNYHSSLLTRGRGALARLAALATPLAVDDDAPKISSLASHKRNFVFAALTPDEAQPKVTIKRKADVNLGTPKLVKKMRIEEKQNQLKSSLLDHLNL